MVTTPVTVTNPIRGSFSEGIVSETTALIASSTRRIRGDREGFLVIEAPEGALVREQLELLPGEPSLSRVEQPLCLAGLTRDARKRQPRPLPDIVVIDLGDRARRCDSRAAP